MRKCFSDVFKDYIGAFANNDDDFLIYHSFEADNSVKQRHFTRKQFLSLGQKAAGVLKKHIKSPNCFFLNCFGCNHYADLAFRLAAAMTGHIPATINWQADSLKQIVYKIEMTAPELILTDSTFSSEIITAIKKNSPEYPYMISPHWKMKQRCRWRIAQVI